MPYEAYGISVLHERIFTGNAFVDRDEDLLFPQELQHGTEATTLSLNHLPYTQGDWYFTSQISLAIHRLKLAHQRNRNHVTSILSAGRHSVRRFIKALPGN
jgi:hypothetical protein